MCHSARFCTVFLDKVLYPLDAFFTNLSFHNQVHRHLCSLLLPHFATPFNFAIRERAAKHSTLYFYNSFPPGSSESSLFVALYSVPGYAISLCLMPQAQRRRPGGAGIVTGSRCRRSLQRMVRPRPGYCRETTQHKSLRIGGVLPRTTPLPSSSRLGKSMPSSTASTPKS